MSPRQRRLELSDECRGERARAPLDQHRHLVADEADVARPLRRHREHRRVADAHHEQDRVLELDDHLVHGSAVQRRRRALGDAVQPAATAESRSAAMRSSPSDIATSRPSDDTTAAWSTPGTPATKFETEPVEVAGLGAEANHGVVLRVGRSGGPAAVRSSPRPSRIPRRWRVEQVVDALGTWAGVAFDTGHRRASRLVTQVTPGRAGRQRRRLRRRCRARCTRRAARQVVAVPSSGIEPGRRRVRQRLRRRCRRWRGRLGIEGGRHHLGLGPPGPVGGRVDTRLERERGRGRFEGTGLGGRRGERIRERHGSIRANVVEDLHDRRVLERGARTTVGTACARSQGVGQRRGRSRTGSVEGRGRSTTGSVEDRFDHHRLGTTGSTNRPARARP